MNAFRIALRRLLRQPGPALSAVLTLGLALGACTALFAVLQTVLLRPLPLQDGEHVVHVFRLQAPVTAGPISTPEFAELEASSDAQVRFAGYTARTKVLRGGAGSQASLLQVLEVSAEYFPVLGAQADIGRVLDASDQAADADSTAVLSAALAQRLFGTAEAALGQTLTLDEHSSTIVGVLPESIAEVLEEEVFIPARFALREDGRGANYVQLLARLQPGVERGALESRLQALTARWTQDYPEHSLGMSLFVRGLVEHQSRNVASMLWLLQGAVLLVLAVAAANVANLALARLAARQRELATESALGADSARLMSGPLAEALLLGTVGLGLGLLLASWGLGLLKVLAPESLPRLSQLQLGMQAWVIAGLAAGLATALSGLLPAWAATRMAGGNGLRAGRSDAAANLRSRWRRGLVIGQLGVSTLLLVSCLLVLLSLSRLAAVDPGFDTERVLTARLSLPAGTGAEQGYAGMLQASRDNQQFLDQLLPQLRAIPGIEAAAAIDAVPLSGSNNWNGSVSIVGRHYEPGTQPTVEWRWISPGYFETLGIPLQRGRMPRTESDARETLINQRFANEHFGNADPIGERIGWWDEEFEIVGVVNDVRQWSLGRPSSAEMYLNYGQAPGPETTTLVLRTELDPQLLVEPLRRRFAELAPEVPLYSLRSMQQIQGQSLSQSTFVLQLLALFALTAVLVSAVGLYGLLAFSVARRGQELGVRLALGATPASVRQLVLGEALQLSAIGVAVGLVGAYFTSRLLGALVYEANASDVLAYICAGLTLALIAACAAWMPASRAARLAPMRALRAG